MSTGLLCAKFAHDHLSSKTIMREHNSHNFKLWCLQCDLQTVQTVLAITATSSVYRMSDLQDLLPPVCTGCLVSKAAQQSQVSTSADGAFVCTGSLVCKICTWSARQLK